MFIDNIYHKILLYTICLQYTGASASFYKQDA